MADTEKNQYVPDYLVASGEILGEYLEHYGMKQAELATRTGLAKKNINEIINGKAPITPETALRFERALGRPAHFWNNLERQFQEDKTKLAEKERLKSHLEWLKKVPVAAMVRLGWISKHKDKVEQLETVLRFFGVSSPEQWGNVCKKYQVAYRQTQRFETRVESVSAWLRQGELLALQIECAPFNRKRFLEILDEIRNLTLKGPDVFVPALENLCASAGVAVVFVPELPKTGAWGATRWLGDKAVIQLSLRYKSNDHLWFTFFHEAGHILKHGRKDVFIEGNGLNGEKEDEANAFARNILIPPSYFSSFLSSWDGNSLDPVKNFAKQIGIAPGIVVGRLQFEGLLPNSHGNKIKVRYTWSDKETG